MDVRIKEAARMGFVRCIMPQTSSLNVSAERKMECFRVNSLKKLLECLF